MIDNLIYDLMKQIWINLELYFEIYAFPLFGDFSGFFLNFYEFNSIYFELK